MEVCVLRRILYKNCEYLKGLDFVRFVSLLLRSWFPACIKFPPFAVPPGRAKVLKSALRHLTHGTLVSSTSATPTHSHPHAPKRRRRSAFFSNHVQITCKY